MKNSLIRVLKYINNVPFPWRAKHYAFFGDVEIAAADELNVEKRWETLRNQHPRYRIPKTRAEWLEELTLPKDGQDGQLPDRVRVFVDFLKRENIKTVYSIGSGNGVFEYYVKRALPEIRLVASEHTVEGVERLKTVLPEADEVWLFDALDENGWNRIGYDPESIVFIYRNEREFTDQQWRMMFVQMHQARIQKVFLGLMNFLTILAFCQERIRNFRYRLRGRHMTLVGYLRNRSRFESFWRMRYTDQEVFFPNCRGIYLKIISK